TIRADHPLFEIFEKDLGLLVNFAPQNIQIKRVLWDEPEFDILEEYSHFKPHLSQMDREILRQLRHHTLTIAQQYGLGYPETVYRQLVALEITGNQLSCVTEIEIPARWDNSVLAHHQTQLLLAADNYLIHIRSLLDFPTQYDFSRMNTYLKSLELQFGLIVNFGKKQLQIYGVRSI
ncbi:MAG TPA: GxxExxY protein, partial [Caldilineaceae bacterium]|nr:GxxExxY protein [Caldilineaceae bacterium]